jgi:hypothetical protein
MGEMRNSYNFFIGKPESRRPHGGSKRRWEDNIRINIQEIRWSVWIGCIWLR